MGGRGCNNCSDIWLIGTEYMYVNISHIWLYEWWIRRNEMGQGRSILAKAGRNGVKQGRWDCEVWHRLGLCKTR